MDITLTVILVCFVVFFIAGFVDAIAGGGGLITMPVLLLLGIPAHYTLGTGKLASSLGSITALITFWKRGAVIKEVVLLGVISSYFGAVIASATTLLISNEKMTIIMIFLLPVAILLSLFCGTLKLTEEDLPKKGVWWRVSAIGLSVGFYEGFFGPGAGSFFLIGIHLLLKASFRYGKSIQYRRQLRRGHNVCFRRNALLLAGSPLRGCQHLGQPLRRNLCRQNRSDARTQHALLRVSHAADFSDNAIRYLIRTRGTRWFTSQRSS